MKTVKVTTKTVKVTTDNRISVIDVDFDDFRSIQNAIGGYFETVHTEKMFQYFRRPMLMLCDEEGMVKYLPLNRLGSIFYGVDQHGYPIAGDIIFAVPDGENILGLEDAEEMKKQLLRDFDFLKEEKVSE